ncbi:hypothetical protein S245_067362, partial [Arachis hypogaea]
KALPYGVTHASKALEPATLVPLQLLKSSGTKCIMVGDPKQLPATVLSNVASKYLYECSMFECLQRAGHPVIMLMLTEQGTRLFVATKLGRIRAAAKQALLEVVQAAPNSIGYYARGKVDVSGRGLHGSRVPSSWSVNRKGRFLEIVTGRQNNRSKSTEYSDNIVILNQENYFAWLLKVLCLCSNIDLLLFCFLLVLTLPMSPKSRDVCIVGVARTPMGDLLGNLSSLSATQLGSIVEVSGGRGKPSRIVDKDEGLGK